MTKKKVKLNDILEKITLPAKNKPKKERKNKIEKPYNSGTFSEAAFWNFIRQALRKRTLVWKPIQNVRKAAKRPYVGENKRRSVAYECSNCHLLWSSDEIAVHHRLNAGKLTCKEDLPNFVMNLFCEEDKLCVLCHKCHLEHHKNN